VPKKLIEKINAVDKDYFVEFKKKTTIDKVKNEIFKNKLLADNHEDELKLIDKKIDDFLIILPNKETWINQIKNQEEKSYEIWKNKKEFFMSSKHNIPISHMNKIHSKLILNRQKNQYSPANNTFSYKPKTSHFDTLQNLRYQNSTPVPFRNFSIYQNRSKFNRINNDTTNIQRYPLFTNNEINNINFKNNIPYHHNNNHYNRNSFLWKSQPSKYYNP
jgi:hypothetical protein